MRSFIAAVVTVAAVPLFASNIRFEPPNPTSRVPVIAHVIADACGASTPEVTRSGSSIVIKIDSKCLHPFIGTTDVHVDLGVLPAGIYQVTSDSGGAGTLTVSDGLPPFMIQPNVERIEGGDQISILGADALYNCALPAPNFGCEAPVVKFGGVAAEVVASGLGEVIVKAPPHAAGTVDVTLEGSKGSGRAIAAFHYFADEAPDAAFFERILVPVFYNGPGGFNSQWESVAALHNNNPYAVTQQAPFETAQPGTTTFAHGSEVTGFVDFVPRQAAPNLQFSLVVRDTSRSASDLGTSVPVVRENAFFDRTFSIVNVPADARYRLGLRLYSYETIPTTLQLRIVSLKDESTLVIRDVPLGVANQHGFAFIGDLTADHVELVGKGPLRIDVTPKDAGTLAWGYVSVTNNDTQHVTVIAPQ